jgi:NADH:ubiquinone oxidoreductase subunit C
MLKFENENLIMEEVDGIIHSFLKIKELNLDIAKSNVEELIKYIKNKKIIVLLDVSNVKQITKDAREYLKIEIKNKKFKAIAFLVKSKLSVFLVSFFIKVNLKNVTSAVKMFKSKKEALLWLEQFKTD